MMKVWSKYDKIWGKYDETILSLTTVSWDLHSLPALIN